MAGESILLPVQLYYSSTYGLSTLYFRTITYTCMHACARALHDAVNASTPVEKPKAGNSPALNPTAHEAAGGGVPKPVRTFAAGLKWPGVLSTPPAPRPDQSIAATFCGCNATQRNGGTGTVRVPVPRFHKSQLYQLIRIGVNSVSVESVESVFVQKSPAAPARAGPGAAAMAHTLQPVPL